MIHFSFYQTFIPFSSLDLIVQIQRVSLKKFNLNCFLCKIAMILTVAAAAAATATVTTTMAAAVELFTMGLYRAR